jgi:hypothetical protein
VSEPWSAASATVASLQSRLAPHSKDPSREPRAMRLRLTQKSLSMHRMRVERQLCRTSTRPIQAASYTDYVVDSRKKSGPMRREKIEKAPPLHGPELEYEALAAFPPAPIYNRPHSRPWREWALSGRTSAAYLCNRRRAEVRTWFSAPLRPG